jgi:hypothetical protein
MTLDSGWISCSDHLPRLVEDILIFQESADVLFTDGKEIWLGVYRYTPADPDWDEGERHEWRDGECQYFDNVVAWQPLPSLECFSTPNSTP